MPRGVEGDLIMSKSHVRNTRTRRAEQKDRRVSVTDSLTKFLDDCNTEDMLNQAAEFGTLSRGGSRPLSASEHGPPRRTAPEENISAPRRRLKKQNSASGELFSTVQQERNFSNSEHGTPSTSKAPLDLEAMTETTKTSPSTLVLDDDDEENVSLSSEEERCSHGRRKHRSSGSRHHHRSHESSSRSRHRTPTHSRSSRSERSTTERSSSRPSRQSGRTTPLRSSPRKGSKRSGHTSANDDSSNNDSPVKSPSKSNNSSERYFVRSKSELATKSPTEKSPQPLRRTRSSGPLERNLANLRSRSASRSRNVSDSDNISVASGRSYMTTRSRVTAGLDAGPLNAFLNTPDTGRRRSRSLDPLEHRNSNTSSEDKYLQRRKCRQDEILTAARRDAFKASSSGRERRRLLGEDDEENGSDDKFGRAAGADPEDKDEPMVKDEKNPLKRLKAGLNKTRRKTRSAVKGTVNVVKDPKRAAKNVGGFAKDVGKETVHMVLNPKMAVKTAATLGKDTVKGTVRVGKNVGTGVAKGGYKTTKFMAKTGFGATTMVAGTVLDGAGRVVHGATGLIRKHKTADGVQEVEYDASALASRRKDTFLDRVSSMVDVEGEGEERRKSGTSGGVVVPSVVLPTNRRSSWEY